MQGYNIATMTTPRADFQEFATALRSIAKSEGVEILGTCIAHGPGCNNLGILLPEPNEQFISTLTMALMPARWCELPSDEPRLVVGQDLDHRVP